MPWKHLPRKRAPYRKRVARRPRASVSSVTSLIKKVQLKQCETKLSSQRFFTGTNAQPLYHNVTNYRMVNLLATTQGVENPQGTAEDVDNRVGHEIIARGLLLKFMFISAQSRPNMNVMVYIYQYDSSISAPADINFWSGPNAQSLLQNRFLDRPNPTKVRVLKRFVIQNRQNYSSNVPSEAERSNTCLKEIYIPLKNKKITYVDNASGISSKTPQWKDIGVAMVAFDTTNTLPSDIVAYVTAQTTLYFKDP